MSIDPATVNLASSAIQDTHLTHHPDPLPDHHVPHHDDTTPSSPNPHHHSPLRRRSLSVSSSILRFSQPPPFKHQHPPLPDMRFEQSYLASIAPAEGVWWKILLLTVKDQVLMPLAQGVLLNLAMFGWRRWNSGVRLAGRGVGARIRRWWWGVNNWPLPKEAYT